jgi:SAM-dependent methyltransferase
VPLPPADIPGFYERGYADAAGDAWFMRWRELGARNKVDHVCRLLGSVPAPRTVLEVGCGEGAVLSELARRHVGDTRVGVDISSSAIRLASLRPEITDARVFDGVHIDAPDHAYDLVICTHVLEHLREPVVLLTEIERVSRAVLIEVTLERNLSARRPGARALSAQSGHLHRFDRASVRRMVASTGWEIRAEVIDHLPLELYTFRAAGVRGHLKAHARWGARSLLAVAPRIGERLMTMHFAVLAVPAASDSPAPE